MSDHYAYVQPVHDDWDDEQVSCAKELAELMWFRQATDHGWKPVGKPTKTTLLEGTKIDGEYADIGYEDENGEWQPRRMNRAWRIEGAVEPAPSQSVPTP